MTIALWCVLVVGIMPIIAAGVAKRGARDYDNHDPRGWLAAQSGWRARANAAQANCFEAIPLFAAAVIVAHVLRGPLAVVDALALAFVVLRVAYVGLYVIDRSTARSLVWVAALSCPVAMFFVAAAR